MVKKSNLRKVVYNYVNMHGIKSGHIAGSCTKSKKIALQVYTSSQQPSCMSICVVTTLTIVSGDLSWLICAVSCCV